MLHAKITKTAKFAKKTVRSLLFSFVLSAIFAIFALHPGSAFAAPATTQSAIVSPEAAAVLTKLSHAYQQLKSLELAGKITGDFDVDGQKETRSIEFSSNYAAPNLFRLDTKDDATIGSTGKLLYAYAKARNTFTTADVPAKKGSADDLPDPFPQLINTQDPSLAFALSADIAEELKSSFAQIDRVDDVKIGDQSFAALSLKGDETIRLLIDPKTNLVRRLVTDLKPQLAKRGASDIKKATLTIDYTTATANPTTKPTQFAWAPPSGSRDAQEAGDEGADPATGLAGKPAPTFTLKDLDGKDVALADLKDSVVVLDFWATWCGPCVGSLPKLDKLYQEFKEQGVKVYAVNQSEDKELVGGFMKSKNLTLPVLLDSDSKVGNKYDAHAIPETVVIGKDGVIRKVFVGAGPDTESKLHDAIQAAIQAGK